MVWIHFQVFFSFGYTKFGHKYGNEFSEIWHNMGVWFGSWVARPYPKMSQVTGGFQRPKHTWNTLLLCSLSYVSRGLSVTFCQSHIAISQSSLPEANKFPAALKLSELTQPSWKFSLFDRDNLWTKYLELIALSLKAAPVSKPSDLLSRSRIEFQMGFGKPYCFILTFSLDFRQL